MTRDKGGGQKHWREGKAGNILKEVGCGAKQVLNSFENCAQTIVKIQRIVERAAGLYRLRCNATKWCLEPEIETNRGGIGGGDSRGWYKKTGMRKGGSFVLKTKKCFGRARSTCKGTFD